MNITTTTKKSYLRERIKNALSVWKTHFILKILHATFVSERDENFVGSIFHFKLLNFIPLSYLSSKEWDRFEVDNLWDFSAWRESERAFKLNCNKFWKGEREKKIQGVKNFGIWELNKKGEFKDEFPTL